MSSKSSTTESFEDILVGLIHKPHGLRGEVAVEPLSDVEGRFAVGSELMLAVPGVPRRSIRVRTCRSHGRGLLITFDGTDTREGAEKLRAGRLEVARNEVPAAAEGEYYHFELVGCRCFDGEADLGEVVAVLEDGGGSMLRVEGDKGNILVPFVQDFLRQVDTGARRIELELPEGLVETCRSKS